MLGDTNDSTMYRDLYVSRFSNRDTIPNVHNTGIVYAWIRDTFVEYVGKPYNAPFSQFRNTIRYPVTNISHEN